MIEFGKTLSDARLAKGLTISQIAESTHMMASIVTDLENENFSKIVAPIYGRGFVKLYCEAVGIDPRPLVAEFMEIYNGNRIPHIKERPVAAAPTVKETPPTPSPAQADAPAPEPVATPEPIPAPEPVPEPSAAAPEPPPATPEPPLAELGPLFSPQRAVPPAQPLPQPAPAPSAAHEPATEPRLSRYASPLHEYTGHKSKLQLPSLSVPPSVWRIAVLALVVIGLLWGLFLGIRALYRITNDQVPPDEPVTENPAEPAAPVASKTETKPAAPKAAAKSPSPAAKTPPSAKAAAPKATTRPAAIKRTPQKIPSLYLD